MVKGANNSTYIKLEERFNELSSTDNVLNSILDIWESKGIENAIKEFKFLNGKSDGYKAFKDYFKLTGSKEFKIKGNSILLFDISGKQTTRILMSKKTESKVSEKNIISALQDNEPIYNFYIAINGHENKNWLFTNTDSNLGTKIIDNLI
jgi:glycine betaine/choline ABC-type transport system substrate-binding protein